MKILKFQFSQYFFICYFITEINILYKNLKDFILQQQQLSTFDNLKVI